MFYNIKYNFKPVNLLFSHLVIHSEWFSWDLNSHQNTHPRDKAVTNIFRQLLIFLQLFQENAERQESKEGVKTFKYK